MPEPIVVLFSYIFNVTIKAKNVSVRKKKKNQKKILLEKNSYGFGLIRRFELGLSD